MKKVLFVATVVKKHINAFHLPYLKWFKENGYETHVCAGNDFEDPKDIDIPFCDKYHQLSFERSPVKLQNIKIYGQLKKIIEAHDYDIIHCHTPMGGALTRLAAKSARIKGTKVIYTAHGFHFYKGAPLLNWLIYYPIEKYLSRLTDTLITINKEDYIRGKNFKAKEISYIPGVGIDTNVKQISIKSDKRKELGFSINNTILISVGELNQNKNHETVIRAIYELKDKNIIYLICGRGELENHLKKLINKLNLQDQVFLKGFREDVEEFYRISDIFIFPSYREGLSLSLMEAMAAGLPIICSKIRGNIDLVDGGRGGYLVNPDSIKEFSKSIYKLKNDKILSRQMSNFNLKKIKKFDRTIINSEMEKIYKI